MTLTLSRTGQVNLAGDTKALYEKIFSEEVLAIYQQMSIMQGKVMEKTITKGKSESFAEVGGVSAYYHQAGDLLVGQQVPHNERIISIDGLLVAPIFNDKLDVAMESWNSRAYYAQQVALKLAQTKDNNELRNVIIAAGKSGDYTGAHDGHSVVSDYFKIDAAGAADVNEQAEALAAGIYQAAVAMDNAKVPFNDRYAIFRPEEYYALVQGVSSNGFSAINTLYGGKGSYADGNIISIAGIPIFKSTELPSTDLSGDTYHPVDASKVVGVVGHKEAVGTVKLIGINTEIVWLPEYRSWLAVSEMAMGHGTLRPECAVVLKLDTLTN